MAQLALDVEFLGDFARLDKVVQGLVQAAIGKFGEHTHAGIHLEKVRDCKDDRVKTIRINQFWRGVVFEPKKDETFLLLKVLPHDKAYEYAARHKWTVNQTLGVVEVHDAAGVERIQPSLEQAARGTEERLFAGVSDTVLTRLGIDANTLVIARLLTSDEHLDAMRNMIPDAQYNVLVGLASGQTPEEVWDEVALYLPADPVDTSDYVAAMERTPGRVMFVNDSDELNRILEHPFAKWRVFLHPAQRKISYAHSYNGPVQVSGGAGTGKTVTAMHRAAFLARRGANQVAAPTSAPSVLLTTFTRNLADSLEAQFELLVDSTRGREQVEILNVDRLAYRVVERSRGGKLSIINRKELEPLWGAAAKGLPFTPSFLNREWEQVILAQDLRAEASYLTASRPGQGTPLGKAQRRQVWSAVQRVTSELQTAGRSTFLQIANEAAVVLGALVEKPYLHVIVDEAQDLHPAQWRLLRAAVAPGPDDLFIVGDPHQRIYDSRVSLGRVGINVRGRSKRLTINYRTTQEILSLAVPALGSSSVTGLDGEADSLNGYRSPLHGLRPEVFAADSSQAEVDALVTRVRGWLDEGIEAHAIGVAARSSSIHKPVNAALKAAGFNTVSLSARSATKAVRVGSMHGMKGLEFQAVAVVGVADGTVPSPSAVGDAAVDRVAYEQDLQRERCLLFVACTRARDHLYLSYSGTPSPFLSGSSLSDCCLTGHSRLIDRQLGAINS